MADIINQSDNNVKGKELKVAFLGTPQFAVPILEKLSQSEFKPAAVFCAPDKPVGRKQILTPPPIKIAAQKYNIPVYQPETVSSFKFQVSSLKIDLIITAAYGIILPKEVLDAPKFGCLNIHPSLLPKYRGPSPIQTAILNGDAETGVTLIKMDEKVDHGPIVKSFKFQVSSFKFTTPELSQKLSELSAQLLIEVLPDWLAGKIKPQPQDESRAIYTKILKKEDGRIDWQKSALEIERQIRAYTPWPGTYSQIANSPPRQSFSEASQSSIAKKINVISADVFETRTDKKIGEIFLTKNGEIAIQTGHDALIPKIIQIEGGKPLDSADFLRGHGDLIGQNLF